MNAVIKYSLSGNEIVRKKQIEQFIKLTSDCFLIQTYFWQLFMQYLQVFLSQFSLFLFQQVFHHFFCCQFIYPIFMDYYYSLFFFVCQDFFIFYCLWYRHLQFHLKITICPFCIPVISLGYESSLISIQTDEYKNSVLKLINYPAVSTGSDFYMYSNMCIKITSGLEN